MYLGKPPSYKSQSAVDLQSDHSLGPTEPLAPISQSAPEPRFYSIPNTRPSRPQAQRFVVSAPPRSNGFRNSVPSRQAISTTPYVPHRPIAQTVKPQAPRKVHAFVASDPFRVFRDDDEIDVPSDGLTFDDIPTAESAPGTELSQGRVDNLHGALPSQTLGGSLPISAPSRSPSPTQLPQAIYPPFQVLINNSQSSRAPEVQIINQIPDTGVLPSISNYQVQYCEVPPVIMPLSPATELPSIIGHRPSSPSHPEDTTTFSHFLEQPIFTRFTNFFRFRRSHGRTHSPNTHSPDSPQPSKVICHDPEIEWHEFVLKIVMVTVPGQLYLLFLLRLPTIYFSRVARIFEEANLSLPEIKKMALETASQGLTHEFEMQMAFDSESPSVPPAYKRLTSTWEFFIDSVMREWKTVNIISVLLLTAILTILQIESAADDPLTRYTALFSLICALISLLFACMYVIRFGSMRKSYKAAEWALEAQKTRTLIWWNVWILLAMPAIWLIWSIILYITCIMSFIWRSRVTDTTPSDISDTGLLAVRIALTVVLGIGLLYGFLILRTFCRYGVVMDKAWQKRIDEWVQGKSKGTPESPFIQQAVDNPQSHRNQSMYSGHPPVPTYSRGTYSLPSHASATYAPTQTPSIKYDGIASDHWQDNDRGYFSPRPEAMLEDCTILNPPVPTYTRGTYSPPSDALAAYDPILRPGTPSIKTRTSNTVLSQSSKLQCDGTASDQDEHLPSPDTTLDDCYYTPSRPISTAEGSEIPPSRLSIQKKPSLVVSPPRRRPLPPIPKTPATPFMDQSSEDTDNALGFSVGNGNRDNGDDGTPRIID